MFDEYEALGVAHLIAGLRPMTEASIDRVALAIERRRT